MIDGSEIDESIQLHKIWRHFIQFTNVNIEAQKRKIVPFLYAHIILV